MDSDLDLLLNAYCDGELSPAETLAMELRLAEDPGLRAEAERIRSLSRSLHSTLADVPVPDGLRADILHDLGLQETTAPPTPTPRRSLLRSFAFGSALMSLLGGMVLGGGTVYLTMRESSEPIAMDIYSAHARALLAPQPFDIASSERHTVKPWFNGKVMIAPDVIDLSAQGFPLAGGRIDVIDGKAVPVLVYRHGGHLISVTVLPMETRLKEGSETHEGFTIKRWRQKDLLYVAISDIAAADLQKFAEKFRAAEQQER
ncbi:anti-sigma factor family protein [Beijerinckia mobilis]|uniref:anti-sigma factor family protein n=1 Tax=Beijerinckia mobilis TaxID=231434 RepID=UPI00055950C3|nr:hypothetical protein [Beijerinckia mobilis]